VSGRGGRVGGLRATISLIVLTLGADLVIVLAMAGGETFAINGAHRFQIIDGFGVNINTASWNAAELRPALDMLLAELPCGPHNLQVRKALDTLAYLNDKGLTTGIIINVMGPVPGWMGGSRISATHEDEWVEMLASLVYYAQVSRGLRFGMLAPMNEPDWDGIEGPQVPAAQYVRLLNKLAARLEGLGLRPCPPRLRCSLPHLQPSQGLPSTRSRVPVRQTRRSAHRRDGVRSLPHGLRVSPSQ
jgi:hypothetical protein